MTDQTIEQMTAERDTLRAKLEQEISELRGQVDGGLTDDQVRRIEHPEEFVSGDAGDTPGVVSGFTGAPVVAPDGTSSVSNTPEPTPEQAAALVDSSHVSSSSEPAEAIKPNPGETQESFLSRIRRDLFGGTAQ